MRCRTCDHSLAAGHRFNFCPRCSLADALAASPDGAPGDDTLEGYELILQLGQGGMGAVWLAREKSLDRLVALKLTPSVSPFARRLFTEGRAAAGLKHPHIVPVYTSGETNGTTFLAMAYLAGGNLEEKLRERSLSPRESAELIHKLAPALAYAHAREILHRDLKPANILLDETGEPHLGDFGLASLLEGGGEHTAHGQIFGSPAYMAPELFAGARLASPQSDVYGLGAILYTCLTGQPPYRGETLADVLGQIATAAPPAPRTLRAGVPRDLESICLKCLARAPADRYATALDLDAEVARFLRGEPVQARPVTPLEQLARWCGRNRAAAALVAFGLVVLLALAIGGPAIAVRFAHERRLAETARAEAEQAGRQAAAEAAASKAVSEFLRNDLLAQAGPDQQPDRGLTLKAVLDRATQRIEGRFPEQPQVEAAVRMTLGETHVSLADYPQARIQFEAALALYNKQLSSDDPTILRGQSSLVGVLTLLADYKTAEPLALATLETQRRRLGGEHPDTLKTLFNLATLYQKQGRFREAETSSREALELQTKVLGPEHADTLKTMANLAALFLVQGKLAEAEDAFTRAVSLMRRTLGEDSPKTLQAAVNLGIVYTSRGKLAEAEELQQENVDRARRVLGKDHAHTLSALNSLAVTYRTQGRMAEAEAIWQEVYEAKRRLLGGDHPDTFRMMNNLTVALVDQAKFTAAAALSSTMLDLQKQKLGVEHPDTLTTRHNLGIILWHLGKLAEAEILQQEALTLKRRVLGPHHNETFQSMDALAVTYVRQGRLAEAEVIATELNAAATRVLGPSHPTTRLAQRNLGRLYLRQGRLDEAARTLSEVLTLSEASRDAAPDFVRSCADSLGEAFLRLNRFAEAENLLRRNLERWERAAPASWQAAITRSLLGAAVLGQGRFEEAEPLLVDGYRSVLASQPPIPPVESTLVGECAERLLHLFAMWPRPEKLAEWRTIVGASTDTGRR